MAVSKRPSNRSERALCLGIVAPMIADPSPLPPAVAAFLAAAVAPAVAAYVTALADADDAAVREGHAAQAAAAASAAFDTALRLWTRTVVDDAGKSLVRELVPRLGTTPSLLMRRAGLEKAERMVRFVPLVSGTALGGDPARLTAVASAAAALSEACIALRSAEGARFVATVTLREAERAFDKAWVAFDRVATAVDPASDLELRFVRPGAGPRPMDPPARQGPQARPVAPRLGEWGRPGQDLVSGETPRYEQGRNPAEVPGDPVAPGLVGARAGVYERVPRRRRGAHRPRAAPATAARGRRGGGVRPRRGRSPATRRRGQRRSRPGDR